MRHEGCSLSLEQDEAGLSSCCVRPYVLADCSAQLVSACPRRGGLYAGNTCEHDNDMMTTSENAPIHATIDSMERA